MNSHYEHIGMHWFIKHLKKVSYVARPLYYKGAFTCLLKSAKRKIYVTIIWQFRKNKYTS